MGAGFGPANLALAVAAEEAPEKPSCLFLEARKSPAWHPGMLLENSLLQISAFKDLVTVCNPKSQFTFLNYLHEKGRLFDFLNLRDLYPTRTEYNDYVTWVARQLPHLSRFGKEVLSVSPVTGRSDEVEALRVEVLDKSSGETEAYFGRNLSLAVGPRPQAPPGVELRPGGKAFHSHFFMHRKDIDFPSAEDSRKFLVIGGAQSGSEIFNYLTKNYPKADITLTIRRFSIKPMDDSHFTNQVFQPHWVDFTYNLPEAKRREFVASFHDVNYAVADKPLIEEIYKTLYRQRVDGVERCRILPFLHLESLTETATGVVAEYRNLIEDRQVTLEADTVILCTGYSWQKEQPILEPLAPYFQRTEAGGFKMERDYSIASDPRLKPKVYLQSYSEETHGIGETVLSLAPVRARDILQSVLANTALQGSPQEHLSREVSVL